MNPRTQNAAAGLTGGLEPQPGAMAELFAAIDVGEFPTLPGSHPEWLVQSLKQVMMKKGTIMSDRKSIIPSERVERLILLFRGERVIVDADLAALYGVTTKVLNQAVKRNAGRFPGDFMFPLTKAEKRELVTNCDHLARLKFSPAVPKAFTEHGAIMAANVLNSERAVEASVAVVRAFVRLRRMLSSNADLSRKLADLERKYDSQFKIVFHAIRQLMEPPPGPRRRPVGFHTELSRKK